jgi:predicted TIM-barrel fold metal-dependent hydrolase
MCNAVAPSAGMSEEREAMGDEGEQLSRRGFLGVGASVAAVAGGLSVPAVADAVRKKRHHKHRHHRAPVKRPPHCVEPAPPPAAAPAGGRIDLHAHHIPPAYRVALLEAGQELSGGYPTPPWTPEEAISFMDDYGIGAQALSISDPGVTFLSGSAAANLARQINEYTADVIHKYPTRFGGFAVLPLPDLEASLNELQYALDTLKLDGVGVLSSYAGQTSAGPPLQPLWAEINARKAFVFLHPTALPSNMKPPSSLPDFLVEFTFETTRWVANALNGGLLSTFPNLRIQLAHAGGAYPYLAWRVGVLGKGAAPLEPPGTSVDGVLPTSATQGLYYDTALSPAPSSMRSVLEITDVRHILFGSDWPYTQALFLRSGDPQPELSLTFPPEERHTVERANALAQLPRLAARVGRR